MVFFIRRCAIRICILAVVIVDFKFEADCAVLLLIRWRSVELPRRELLALERNGSSWLTRWLLGGLSNPNDVLLWSQLLSLVVSIFVDEFVFIHL